MDRDDSRFNLIRIGLAIIFLILFIVAFYRFESGKSMDFDESVARSIAGMRDGVIVGVAKFFTFCGNPITIVVLCIILILLPNRMQMGIPIAATTAFGAIVHTIIKFIVARPRPDGADTYISVSGYSFPSGHANGSLIFFLLLMVLLSRILVIRDNTIAAWLLRGLMIILVFFIGMSRVYLGAHYISDVWAGWMLGATIMTVAMFLYETIWPRELRISYFSPEWKALPKDYENVMKWKRPPRGGKNGEMLEFPKKRGYWKFPENVENSNQADQVEEQSNFFIDNIGKIGKIGKKRNKKKRRESSSDDKHTPLI